MGVKNAKIRPAAGNGFVLGSVNKNPGALIGARDRNKVFDAMGAGDGTPHPATVVAGIKYTPVYLLAHIDRFGMPTVLKVVDRKEIEIIHYGNQMSCPDFGHFVLLWIEFPDFLRVFSPHFL